MKPSTRDALGLALALVAAWLAHCFVLDLELMGWDSYPIIAASRIASGADLAGSFSEALMDGRYPDGGFYRPVINLAFAADYAVWGLRPFGYQLTNLLLLLAGVAATWALARRWCGAGAAPFCAALVFALHPLQVEAVPVAARRADMLFSLFLVLALLAVPLGDRAPRHRVALAAVCVLLSAATKETGAVALPVLVAAVWWLPARGDTTARTRRALARCLPAVLAFALFLLLRTAVLGGLGGHPGRSSLLGATLALGAAPAVARSLVMPQPWTQLPLLDTILAGLLVLALLALPGLRAPAAAGEADAERPSLARLGAFLAFWLGCLLAMTGVSGMRASWYGVPFLAPYALLLGALGGATLADAKRGRRAAALIGGGLVLVLLASHVRFSPLLQRYEEWEEVSQQSRVFLERLREAVAAAPPDTTVAVAGLPLGTGVPLELVGVRSALCLADYSAEAWAELAFPDRKVRVKLHAGGEPTPPTPGSVTIDATPLPSPALGSPPGAAR